jgi:hypothetical protein
LQPLQRTHTRIRKSASIVGMCQKFNIKNNQVNRIVYSPLFWYEIGFAISFVLNVILLVVVVGIVFPPKKSTPNPANLNMVYLLLGVLFGLLGNMCVAVMTHSPPFDNPLLAMIVLAAFCGSLFYALILTRS